MIGDSVIRVGDEAPWRIAKSPRTLGGASSFVHLYVLKASEKKDHLPVDVSGDVQGDTLKGVSVKLF
ncbi:MAG: hypothetical protein WB607_03910 [Candidatus Acidiferrum sp.]|jgi:hypothetical protein